MSLFQYKNNELYVENVPLAKIAQEHGTPCYVYSKQMIEQNWQHFDEALADSPHRICFAVKANSNIAILNLLAKRKSGFDIVSLGELERVLKAKGDPSKIVFSGVGKSNQEMNKALACGIYCFNVESESELIRLNSLAKEANTKANVILRINPNIDAKTHHYIATGLKENKFGIDPSQLKGITQKMKTLSSLNLIGLGCHIGSQLTQLTPFLEAIDCLLLWVDELNHHGFHLTTINIGGGLGVKYQNETPPTIQRYLEAICQKVNQYALEIIFEPGRAIVADAGALLTKVEYLKFNDHKNFAIVDAAMNDLMRPALYDAWQDIKLVQIPDKFDNKHFDIVGPVCESADFLGKNRELTLAEGSLLAIQNAGAYGFSMSSNYNSRPRPPEILVEDVNIHVIRTREKIEDLFSLERLC